MTPMRTPHALRRARTRLVLAGAVLLALTAVGIGAARIPGANGQISACYAKADGAVRVIDAERGIACTPSETAISWSRTGPAGAPGAAAAGGGGTTATFASTPLAPRIDATFVKVVAKSLPAGAWTAVATVNTRVRNAAYPSSDEISDARCELRSGTAVIGGAVDRRVVPEDDSVKRSLTMNGGAQIPSGGGEVSVWCSSQSTAEFVEGAQIMLVRIGGFS